MNGSEDGTAYREMVGQQSDEQINIWAADLFVDFAKRRGVGTAIAAFNRVRIFGPPSRHIPLRLT